jgi:hypothetical protein
MLYNIIVNEGCDLPQKIGVLYEVLHRNQQKKQGSSNKEVN